MNKFGRDLTWVGVIKVGVISVGSLTVVWCMSLSVAYFIVPWYQVWCRPEVWIGDPINFLHRLRQHISAILWFFSPTSLIASKFDFDCWVFFFILLTSFVCSILSSYMQHTHLPKKYIKHQQDLIYECLRSTRIYTNIYILRVVPKSSFHILSWGKPLGRDPYLNSMDSY